LFCCDKIAIDKAIVHRQNERIRLRLFFSLYCFHRGKSWVCVMRFVGSGRSRAVILIGPYAFKIARFGLGYMLHRAVAILRSGQAREKIVEWKRDRNLSVCGVLCERLSVGIMCNMREYHWSRNHSDFSLMPTLWTFFYLVNVQRRGNAVADETKLNHPLLRLLEGCEILRPDIDRPEQYCWHGRRLLLVDYAHPDLEGVLGRRQLRTVS
jgi:hypothetical protein